MQDRLDRGAAGGTPRAAGKDDEELRVLFSFGPPDDRASPYPLLLVQHLGASINVKYFSWPTALLARYEVFHLHWPEQLLRSRSRLKGFVKQILALVLLAKLRVSGTRVVSTIHNDTPHEAGGAFERFYLNRLSSLTCEWIKLNRATPDRKPGTTLIPLGTFREYYQASGAARVEAGHYVYFGLIRRYKGVPDLLRSFAALEHPTHRVLEVLGRCEDGALKDEIQALADQDPRVRLTMEHVPDGALVAAIRRSEAAVLPYIKVENTSAAITALSLGCPVVLPRLPTTETLQEEFGSNWVSLYDPPLTSTRLQDSLKALRESQSSRGSYPAMVGRDWTTIGSCHEELYRRVVAARPPRVQPWRRSNPSNTDQGK